MLEGERAQLDGDQERDVARRPRSRSSVRARPVAPPAQPQPNDGVRRTSARSPRRAASSTSTDGAPTPVTDVTTTWSTSAAATPASSSARRAAASARSVAAARNASFDAPNVRRSAYAPRGSARWRVSTPAWACSRRASAVRTGSSVSSGAMTSVISDWVWDRSGSAVPTATRRDMSASCHRRDVLARGR
ncbi:hypothetical protein BJF88_13795 [Cellulosimicrobium sp. CUA-896]|nr:hypothetical protein BJF88_13795 [Cellulosimicrobium sp. CUA-896]